MGMKEGGKEGRKGEEGKKERRREGGRNEQSGWFKPIENDHINGNLSRVKEELYTSSNVSILPSELQLVHIHQEFTP